MKATSYLMAAWALGIPAAAMAQAAPQQAAPQQAPQQAPHQAAGKMQAEIKGYVLPMAAGIESAQASAAALHALSTTEPFERKDARKTAEVGEKAVRVAHEQAEDLSKMKGLSPEAHAQAQIATSKLKEARSTMEHIQRQVGILEKPFERHEAENVRNLSAKLQKELEDAKKATQNVANRYQISTKLELPGQEGGEQK